VPISSEQLSIDPVLLQRLKGIELRSRFLVRGLYHNRHRTNDFGKSTEFVEHREYRRGDDLRDIDWRVFARTDRFYVKVHEMESNMRVMCLLDASDSMRVPPPPGLPSKLDLGAVICGATAAMVQTQQDAVGVATVGDRIEEFIPPRQGPAHLALIYQHLARPRGRSGGSFGSLVREAGARLGQRGVVFLITDALDDPVQLFEAVRILRAREQDVSLIQVLDRNEIEFPFDSMTEFRHPETGRRIIGDPAALRDRYLERLREFVDRIEVECKKLQVDYLRLHNGEDLVALLSLHFIRRMLMGTR